MNSHVAEYWLFMSMVAERQGRPMAQWFYHAQYRIEVEE